jgi:hypothetical protein
LQNYLTGNASTELLQGHNVASMVSGAAEPALAFQPSALPII